MTKISDSHIKTLSNFIAHEQTQYKRFEQDLSRIRSMLNNLELHVKAERVALGKLVENLFANT